MVLIKRDFAFKFIEWIIYFILTGVAITFIVQGKVLDKYLKERSTFAQSEEPITDHPTIISCVKPKQYWQDLVLGTDFGIRYMINGDPTSEMHLYPKIDNVTGIDEKEELECDDNELPDEIPYGNYSKDISVLLHVLFWK